METADKITIETTIHASIEKVWKAWTDPALIMNWFGSDPGGKVLEARLDVRPGGRFEITFQRATFLKLDHMLSGRKR